MRHIAPLLLTLIAVCAATTAHAVAQAPAADTARLAQFLPIARAAWPGSRCAGREQVMNGEGDIDWPACDRATDPPATERVEGELRSVLPAPRAAWRVTCGERRGTHRRCVARRGRSLRRYAVTEGRTAVTVVRED